MNDVTLTNGVIHYKTFFKKFHKFAYLNPKSNHPKHVFKGLLRTECIRFCRNSSTKEDYKLSVNLLGKRLIKAWVKFPPPKTPLLSMGGGVGIF